MRGMAGRAWRNPHRFSVLSPSPEGPHRAHPSPAAAMQAVCHVAYGRSLETQPRFRLRAGHVGTLTSTNQHSILPEGTQAFLVNLICTTQAHSDSEAKQI